MKRRERSRCARPVQLAPPRGWRNIFIPRRRQVCDRCRLPRRSSARSLAATAATAETTSASGQRPPDKAQSASCARAGGCACPGFLPKGRNREAIPGYPAAGRGSEYEQSPPASVMLARHTDRGAPLRRPRVIVALSAVQRFRVSRPRFPFARAPCWRRRQ
jgi:hypothetical protein